MSNFKLSYRYAKSLIDLAESQNELDVVYNDMELFLQYTEGSRDLSNLLKKPIVKSHQKLKILEILFKDKISKLTMSFFNLITKKGRDYFLEGIASEYLRQWKIKRGVIDAHLLTAVPLDPSVQEKIKSLIKSSANGKIKLHSTQEKEANWRVFIEDW